MTTQNIHRATATGGNVIPLNLKGKEYVTVNQRVLEAHQARDYTPQFSIIASDPVEIGERLCWKATIEVAGKQFIGTAQIFFGGKGADATNPIECAETSAIGRALAFAGFGIVDGIASAEEVASAQARQNGNGSAEKPIKPAPGKAASKPDPVETGKIPLTATQKNILAWFKKTGRGTQVEVAATLEVLTRNSGYQIRDLDTGTAMAVEKSLSDPLTLDILHQLDRLKLSSGRERVEMIGSVLQREHVPPLLQMLRAEQKKVLTELQSFPAPVEFDEIPDPVEA